MRHIRRFRSTGIILATFAFLTLLAIDADAQRSTPVTVVNDDSNPVPVTTSPQGNGYAGRSTPVTIVNDDQNPIPIKMSEPCGINVLSADGEPLGNLVGIFDGSDMTIYIPQLGHFMKITTGSTSGEIIHFENWLTDYLYYESENCSGLPYIKGGISGQQKSLLAYFLIGYLDRIDFSMRFGYGEPFDGENVVMRSKVQTGIFTCTPCSEVLTEGFKMREVTLPFAYPVSLPCNFQ